ncbi:hypothetical protein GNI_119160 [Gregarina niphandrodes]|uniref:Uncharacterized protein n=1 Tax=Gregarina niphandrodes TaxID=110365 RepID=A0A023B2M5_GRENI|nr:hypothetical protein GNI_119160 [Gregarina niphandrodes]EZG55047.1 hypothetical protein GNI_119160 [Gregarina niphandrodes]|eukprot:XP_011131814.1 hypothetical protein GNI_119160 [Gregarina niphandrodes]
MMRMAEKLKKLEEVVKKMEEEKEEMKKVVEEKEEELKKLAEQLVSRPRMPIEMPGALPTEPAQVIVDSQAAFNNVYIQRPGCTSPAQVVAIMQGAADDEASTSAIHVYIYQYGRKPVGENPELPRRDR